MSTPVSYTPPDRAGPQAEGAESGPVRRRHVFYLPGYDPEARTRYRLLFVRELTRHAKRFGGGKDAGKESGKGGDKREISRAGLSADGLVQSWSVAAHPASGGAQTGYDVLLWDDIVARDAARSRFVSAALLVVGTLHALVRRKLFTFYRLNWKYGNIIIYPFVMVLLLAILTAGTALLVHAHLGEGNPYGLHLPPWATLPLGILAGLAWIRGIEALLNKIYFWQLLNDWVFNWQHGQGRRPDYERRLDVFADIVQARLQELEGQGAALDEILIVGHSTGALTAVELAARLLARDPEIGRERAQADGRRGPSLSLATLGSGLALVAVQPQASRLRAEIARIVADRRIAWVDYVAPQDWLNFPRFNPLRELDLPLAPGAPLFNPIIRSARFRDIIDEETYLKVRFKPFRMHFQFLMANDRPGAYDFFAMTLGPQRLRERALACADPSPSQDVPQASTAPPPACETLAA